MNDDLISRSAFLKRMMHTARYFYVKFDIMEEPAVDAVEVVRCKDCKYYRTHGQTSGMCYYGTGMRYMYDDEFCSRGERRTNNAND